MDLKNAFNTAVLELAGIFGVAAEYKGDVVEPVLSSANEVNVTIGLSKGLKGVVLLGMKRTTALKIASVMAGSELTEMDECAEGAISEFMNTLVGMGLGNYKTAVQVDFSSPTLIVGDEMYLMISRVESSRLQFMFDNEPFCIAISIE